jgi:hypothetical protein
MANAFASFEVAPNEVASLHGAKPVHGAPVKLARVALALAGQRNDDQGASDGGAQGIGRFGHLQGAADPQEDIAQYFQHLGIEIELFRELCNFFRG